MILLLENIKKYEKMVISYANRFRYYYDVEDLKQVGLIGLMKALENYDNNQNTKFSTYAFLYIKGEILKYIREDRNIKISKEMVSLGKSIEHSKDVLRQKLMREPSLEELSLFLEIDVSILQEGIQAQEFVKSLDYVLNEDEEGKELNLYNTVSYCEKGYDSDILDLKQAIDNLDEEEKRIIKYRYYDDLTQSEISEILGVNQVKVSRTETKILKKLKDRLVA